MSKCWRCARTCPPFAPGRRRSRTPTADRRTPGGAGVRGGAGRQRRTGPRAGRAVCLRPADHRPAAGRHRRHAGDQRRPLEIPGDRRHRHHRLRDRARRGGSDQEGRVRFHRQAVPLRRADARGPEVDGAAAAAIGERIPAIAARGALPVRRHPGAQPRDAVALPDARNRGAFGQHDPGNGRDGHGQGSRGEGDSSQQPAQGAPLRGAQLQRDSRNAARSRALRPRARRVHRRGGHASGPLRAGAQGHAVPRRSGNDEPGAADEAPARAAGARVRARGRQPDHQGGRPRDCRHQLGAAAHGGRRIVSRGSVLPPQRDPHHAPSAARAPRGHPGARQTLPRQVRCGRADGGLAGGHADADGVLVARQRASARERYRARGHAERRPEAHRSRGPSAGSDVGAGGDVDTVRGPACPTGSTCPRISTASS